MARVTAMSGLCTAIPAMPRYHGLPHGSRDIAAQLGGVAYGLHALVRSRGAPQAFAMAKWASVRGGGPGEDKLPASIHTTPRTNGMGVLTAS